MDIDFYLSRCEREFTNSEIVLTAPTRWAAEGLLKGCAEVASWAIQKGRDLVVIRFPGDNGKPFEIPGWYAAEQGQSGEPSTLGFAQSQHPLNLKNAGIHDFIPLMELDFNAFLNHQNPIYINDFDDGTVVFANKAALVAQSKTRKQFFGEKVESLNYPDELEDRVYRLSQGEDLREYNYSAMRWFQDESGVYRRQRMNFHSNFGTIDFLGDCCWFSMVLEAIATGNTVDAGEK